MQRAAAAEIGLRRGFSFFRGSVDGEFASEAGGDCIVSYVLWLSILM